VVGHLATSTVNGKSFTADQAVSCAGFLNLSERSTATELSLHSRSCYTEHFLKPNVFRHADLPPDVTVSPLVFQCCGHHMLKVGWERFAWRFEEHHPMAAGKHM
jgi:hypothetical protein